MSEKREKFATFWAGLQGDGNDWMVQDASGLSYESRIQAACSWLGFCGCGDPEAALQTVVDVLSIYVREPWSHERYERQKAREAEIFGSNEGIPYLIWYWLTDLKLMEHGGAVPGWLTEDGNVFLKTATELLAKATEVP